MPSEQPSPSDDRLIPISNKARFAFRCAAELPCFNACCRDLNQFLAPYDILRLKNQLNICSGEFLETYTCRHIGPQTGLPVVTLQPKEGGEKECPFVTDNGCGVYPGRPSSCRIYPLARAVSRCRQTGRLTQHFALIHEPHCLGFQQPARQTVTQWLQSQQLDDYLEQNDRFLEIIALKNQLAPGPLDLRRQHLFQVALYDIDALREHVLEKGLLASWRLSAQALQRLETDDEALLQCGHRFVFRMLSEGASTAPGHRGQSESIGD